MIFLLILRYNRLITICKRVHKIKKWPNSVIPREVFADIIIIYYIFLPVSNPRDVGTGCTTYLLFQGST